MGTVKLSTRVTWDPSSAEMEVTLRMHDEMTTVHQKESLEYLGLLNHTLSAVLVKLSELTVRLDAFVLAKDLRPSDGPPIPSTSRRIHIIVYGFREHFDAVGALLSENEVFLQHPDLHHWDREFQYENPHYLRIPGSEIIIIPDMETRPSLGRNANDITAAQIDDVFGSAQGPENYSEVESSSRLVTALMRYVSFHHLFEHEVASPTSLPYSQSLTDSDSHQKMGLAMLVEKENGKLESTDFNTLWECFYKDGQKMYDTLPFCLNLRHLSDGLYVTV
jgi:hypothetical protein